MMPQLEASLRVVILTAPSSGGAIYAPRVVNHAPREHFIVQVSLMTIVIYDHHIFIVQVDQWSLVVQDIFSAYTAAAKSWCLLKLFTAFRNKLECLSLLVASSQVKHLQAKPELTRV
jgi:hypothetical protein